MFNERSESVCGGDDLPVTTQGEFNGFTVASFLQLIETDALDCYVQVNGEGLQRGTIFFEGGAPLDASCGRLIGDEAIFEMIAWGAVRIVFLETPENAPGQSVTRTMLALVMEGSRLMDERRADWKGDDASGSTRVGQQIQQSGESTMAGLKQMMKDIADEMDGVIAVGVVGMDGITVAVHNPTGADMDVVSAKFAMVMKLVERSVDDMENLGNFEENLVQTANAWILTRFLNKQYYLACIVSREGTLGNVRLVAKKYQDQVQRAL